MLALLCLQAERRLQMAYRAKIRERIMERHKQHRWVDVLTVGHRASECSTAAPCNCLFARYCELRCVVEVKPDHHYLLVRFYLFANA